MDTTSAVIVLLFFISIFTSLGNKGYTPPVAPSGAIYNSTTVSEPNPVFSPSMEADSRPSIEKFISKYRNGEESAAIAASIIKYSQTYNVNPKLVTALIKRESKFNPRATSSSGAMGLGQLLPSTAQKLGVTDGYDIDQNVYGTVRYLKSLLDRFNGKVSSAIAAYLEGPNAVDRQGGFSEHTRTYVEDILSIYQQI